MAFEYSPSSDLFLPERVAEELDAAHSIEKRGFTSVPVRANLGKVSLGCIYYHPEESIDDTPIGIVKGLGAPRGVYLGLAQALAERGKPVFLYKSPRTQPIREMLSREHLSDPLLYQMQAVHALIKALHHDEQVSNLRGGTPVDTIDLAGHSMGNHIMVGAVHHDVVEKPFNDVHIRTMTSVGGAGVDGGSGKGQLIRHAKQLWPGIAVEEIWKGLPLIINSAPRDIKKDAIRHIFLSLPRITRETMKIVWSPSVEEKALELKARGIPYGNLLPKEDQFFRYSRVLRESGHIFDDNYAVIENMNHVSPNTMPNEFAPYMIAMVNVLVNKLESEEQPERYTPPAS